jgi:hypothetical protein
MKERAGLELAIKQCEATHKAIRKHLEIIMAKNTGEGYRKGSVNDRSQVKNSKTGQWVKRDTETGEFIEVKQDGEPFKGVAKVR